MRRLHRALARFSAACCVFPSFHQVTKRPPQWSHHISFQGTKEEVGKSKQFLLQCLPDGKQSLSQKLPSPLCLTSRLLELPVCPTGVGAGVGVAHAVFHFLGLDTACCPGGTGAPRKFEGRRCLSGDGLCVCP